MTTSLAQRPSAIHEYVNKHNVPVQSYFIAGMNCAAALTTNGVTANTLKAIPFVVASGCTITEIAVAEMTTGAGASGQMGIYSNISDDNIYPSGLLGETTQHSIGSSGIKTGAVSIGIQVGKIYWAVYGTNNSHSMRVFSSATALHPIYGLDIEVATAAPTHLELSRTYEANLPTNFPLGATPTSASTMPAIRLKFSFP